MNGPARHLRMLAAAVALSVKAVAAFAGPDPVDRAAMPPPAADELESLRSVLGRFEFGKEGVDPGLAGDYIRWYGLDLLPESHLFGAFRSGGYRLAAHAYRPAAARATVIVMHGYLDHTGSHGAAIRHLLQQGYAVAAYDQPGHGLSSGSRSSIGDFGEYLAIFRDFLEFCITHMPRPCHVVAHSTGASIIIEHLLTSEYDALGEVVLVAPLIHSAHWSLSTTAAAILGPFIDTLPRVFRENTSDRDYIEFVRIDPLQPSRASVDWFEALVAWNERIENHPSSPRPLTVIQGDDDSVVDWKYNIQRLGELFPSARIEIISGGRHQLLNEAPALQTQVLELLDEALASSPGKN